MNGLSSIAATLRFLKNDLPFADDLFLNFLEHFLVRGAHILHFLAVLFEDLALPNLSKRHLKGNSTFKYERAGYTTDGVPTKLSVLRSLQSAKARRIQRSSSSRGWSCCVPSAGGNRHRI